VRGPYDVRWAEQGEAIDQFVHVSELEPAA
jgi:hypothetical protein